MKKKLNPYAIFTQVIWKNNLDYVDYPYRTLEELAELFSFPAAQQLIKEYITSYSSQA